MLNFNKDQSQMKVYIEEYNKPLPNNIITTLQPLTNKPLEPSNFPPTKSK